MGNYYSPTATEVAIGQRSPKLFLPKNQIGGGVFNINWVNNIIFCRIAILPLLLRVQNYTFIFYYQTFPKKNFSYKSKLRALCAAKQVIYKKQKHI